MIVEGNRLLSYMGSGTDFELNNDIRLEEPIIFDLNISQSKSITDKDNSTFK